jgi:uncharacterized membrane protein YoaK (UPF0700 family)
MAFVAGAVNAGGFLAIARYTSHMSGIISAIGDDLALNNFISVLGGISLLLSFLFGAATTAIIVNWGHRRKIHSEFALPLLLEAALLLVFGLVGANLNVYLPLTVPAIALLLCFVMGLQNAIVTKASRAEIRTTHMTGVITDIGIELGKLVYWNKSIQANAQGYVKANREKLRTHLFIFGMFLIGGIIGAISFCSDAGVILAQVLNQEFQCSNRLHFDAENATNKVRQRQIWEASNLAQPKFQVFSDSDDTEWQFVSH